MQKYLFKKAINAWLLLAFLATINGITRNALYKPFVGDLMAHQISTFILIAVIFSVAYFAFRKNIIEISQKELLQIGFVWLILTEAFEFLAGHYIFGNPWEKILADYNIFAGRIWVLIPLATLLAPYLVGKFLKNRK